MSKFENHKNYNCEVVTDQGHKYLVFADWIHNNQLDNFKGWNCDAGITRLAIDENLNVYSAYCENDYLGNAVLGFDLNQQTICKQNTCTGCTDDLIVKKSK